MSTEKRIDWSTVAMAVIVLGLIAVLFIALGCSAESRVVGPSLDVRRGNVTTVVYPDGRIERVADEAAGVAKGGVSEASGDKTAADVDTTAPTLDLGGVSGKGGAGGGSASARLNGFPFLLGVGIFLCMGGGAMLYLGNLRAALGAFGLGGAMVVAALLPAWALFVVLGGATLAGGLYLYAEYRGDKAAGAAKLTHDALTNVFGGVRSALKDKHPDALNEVRRVVGERMKTAPKQQAIMDEIKRTALEGN